MQTHTQDAIQVIATHIVISHTHTHTHSGIYKIKGHDMCSEILTLLMNSGWSQKLEVINNSITMAFGMQCLPPTILFWNKLYLEMPKTIIRQ